MQIIFPNDTVDTIDSIRDAIGRDVTFRTTISSIACTTCSLDPVTNLSTDPFCVECEGAYWITVFSGIPVKAHITWGHSDETNWVTGGQYFEGDCRIQLKYTDENITIIDNAESVEVDGKTMDIRKRILRGVPEINRILLDLIEKE